jgi:CRISPR-associated protein Cas5h
LGAIIGLAGYQKKGVFPEYYQKLKALPVGIEPLGGYHEKGNFQKTSVKYTNTVGYANADGNLLIEESMLIRPGYRCYILLDLVNSEQKKLYEYLQDGKAEFIPYFGKNEYPAWWSDESGENSFKEYEFSEGSVSEGKFKVLTVFRKTIALRNNTEDDTMENYNPFDFEFGKETFMYFERLPTDFVSYPQMIQYDLQNYALSNLYMKSEVRLPKLYFLADLQAYVQLA